MQTVVGQRFAGNGHNGLYYYYSTSERYFTLSVCHIVECTRRQRKGNSKNMQMVVGRRSCKWIERSVLQLLLLEKKYNYLLVHSFFHK